MVLDGRTSVVPAKEVARRLGLLPQTRSRPEGITVADLVARGRYPHQGLLRQWTPRTSGSSPRRWRPPGSPSSPTGSSTNCPADSGSGSGSRWRSPSRPASCCWTSRPPTSTSRTRSTSWTCAPTSTRAGRTLVAVLHDLNHAARYATHLIAMKDGDGRRRRPPDEIVTAELVEEVFGLRCQVVPTRRRARPRWCRSVATGPDGSPLRAMPPTASLGRSTRHELDQRRRLRSAQEQRQHERSAHSSRSCRPVHGARIGSGGTSRRPVLRSSPGSPRARWR